MKTTRLSLLTISALVAGSLFMAAPAEAKPSTELPLLHFPVISDIHVQAKDKLAQQKLKAALTDLHSIDPSADAMVVNGDIGNGQPQDYDVVRSILSEVPHPSNSWFTIGNHEFYKAWFNAKGDYDAAHFPNGETEQMSINRFLSFAGAPGVYYDKWVKGYHFLFLGSEHYRQSNPNNQENAYLSAQQLFWLTTKLNEDRDPHRPTFVFLHQPLPKTVSGSWTWYQDRSVIQSEELTDILQQHPEAILFSGHTHWELNMPSTFAKYQFLMVNSSSVEQPYSKDDEPLSSDRSEGLYVEVYEDKVIIRGRDFHNRQWIPQAQYALPLNSYTYY